MKTITAAVLVLAGSYVGSGAGSQAAAHERLELVAEYGQIATGVAVTPEGRVFINTPAWFEQYDAGVFEIVDGELVAFPDDAANAWDGTGADTTDAWVCVQSVHVDRSGALWVLDPGAPGLQGPIAGAPKLVRFENGERTATYRFDVVATPQGSYLNDVRIDVEKQIAYVTDSGLGAILTVDLKSGSVAHMLTDDASTKAEQGFVPVVGGRELRLAGNGEVLMVQSDGLALDAENGVLYWQALTGRTLYRAQADAIVETAERVGETVMTDGMARDDAGNIYFSALEHDAVIYRTAEGELKTLVQDERIRWPDSFQIQTVDGEAWLYFTAARIHDTAWFTADGSMPESYTLWRVPLPE